MTKDATQVTQEDYDCLHAMGLPASADDLLIVACHRETATATLTAQVDALTAERDALREALRKLDNAAGMVCQWRSTIMVRFDGQIDFGQWSGLHNSFDRLEDGRVHARAALASASEGEG